MKKTISCILVILMLAPMILCAVTAGSAANDPTASYTPTPAEHEDSTIRLWFDYSSKKIKNSDTQSSGMNTFAAYMAKNEIEDIQFVLCADANKTEMQASVTPLTNENGDTVSSELFIQYYHDCGTYGMVPDAIPPLSAYGAFDLNAGQSQAFLIKLKTTADTPAGWYSGTLTIHNSVGQEVKKATVFAYVWDFALSEETACATSINLDLGYLTRAHKGTSLTNAELYKVYYDYMLENRICAYTLPYTPYHEEALAYIDNPRVTSFQYPIENTSIMRRLFNGFFKDEENGEKRFNKAYYFSNVVDAAKPADLDALKTHYDKIANAVSSYAPDYAAAPFWFISTYINDIDYPTESGDTIDQIEYYSDFVNLWCSKTFAYTGKEELSVPGAKIMQPEKWDAIYGTFRDRMAEKQKNGQKVWWFISWDVEAPYINYYMQTDGTAQRILFWQQFDNNVEGFLYNFVNFWLGDTADPYANNVSNAAYPNAHGESILLYPGTKYGLDGPVGSLRMEAMRDGIEDYQMLTMLREVSGTAGTDPFIDRLTTGMVHYSTNAEEYYNVRKALGDTLERSNCAHEYECAAIPANCTTDGSNIYTCKLCGHTYTATIPATGHTFVNGTCTVCGAPAVKIGDANGDGRITPADVTLLRLYIAGKLPPDTSVNIAASDVDGNGRITPADITALRLLLAGKSPA